MTIVYTKLPRSENKKTPEVKAPYACIDAMFDQEKNQYQKKRKMTTDIPKAYGDWKKAIILKKSIILPFQMLIDDNVLFQH